MRAKGTEYIGAEDCAELSAGLLFENNRSNEHNSEGCDKLLKRYIDFLLERQNRKEMRKKHLSESPITTLLKFAITDQMRAVSEKEPIAGRSYTF